MQDDKVPDFKGGVTGADSFEDMTKQINESVDAADAQITPAQEAIGVGDHYRMRSIMFGHVLFIYGLVKEKTRMKGMRFVEAFSEGCIEGELGDAHVSNMTKITVAEFEAARANGWMPQK